MTDSFEKSLNTSLSLTFRARQLLADIGLKEPSGDPPEIIAQYDLLVDRVADHLRQVAAEAREDTLWPLEARFKSADLVRTVRGAEWEGHICGWYRALMTPLGYAVLSNKHRGAVQIYAENRLELVRIPK